MSDPISRLNTALEGRYRIEREVGSGGMATVYLADDVRHHRKVALKVLRPDLAAIVGGDRFLAEIETTANLQHPHILPLFDSGEADGFLFFVMPFVAGETLREKLDREKQLGVEEAVGIATKISSALGYAHQSGIVHRDIKPGNILLSEIGEPMVADFGIALAVAHAGSGRVTETGLSLGTPHYMSPEQATGDREIGPRSDVYALGCILYEMLTGEPPFTGSNAQAVLGRIITGDAPRPTAVRASIPANVDATIRRALEKLPADRFSTAQDFSRALADKSFRHGESGEVGAGAGPGIWKPLSIGLGVLAVLLGAGFAWLASRPPPAGPVARWEMTLPEGFTGFVGSGPNLALSPDGTLYVFVGVSDDGVQQLWLRPMDQILPVPMRGTENATNPRFSPNGEEVAFVEEVSGSLLVASVSGAPPRTVRADSVAAGQGGIAWGSDGMLYFKKPGAGIWRVSSDGGDAEPVTTIEGVEHEWPEALPNGRGLLLTLDYGSATGDSVAVYSFETGKVTALAQGAMARYAGSGHLVYASGLGTLLVAPFDLDRPGLAGPSRPVAEGIQVFGGSASQFALSESGALAYRLGAAGSSGVPAWVGRDGSMTLLDETLTGSFQAPAISPDGGRIAFQHLPVGTATPQIWVYTIAQRTFAPLTFGEAGSLRPFWSPNGSEVGFVSNLEPPLAVFSVPSDGSDPTPRLLARADEEEIQEAIWTPDGQRLILRLGTTSDPDTDLYHVAAHPDSVTVPIFDNAFVVYSPALSPDGRCLAYTSEEAGRREVYMRPYPGPGGRTPVSVGGGTDPAWSPDGDEILYMDGAGVLVVVTVRTTPDCGVLGRVPHPEWPRPVSPSTTQDFDVSPLDGRVLIIQASADASQPGGLRGDVIVQNFFEVLKGLFPE